MDDPILKNFLTRLADSLFRPLTQHEAVLPAGWYSLPGGRLELNDTGFVIELITKVDLPPYLLIDPDGRQLTRSYVLQPLKDFAEVCSKERAQFRPGSKS
jgi:hypothetical protein